MTSDLQQFFLPAGSRGVLILTVRDGWECGPGEAEQLGSRINEVLDAGGCHEVEILMLKGLDVGIRHEPGTLAGLEPGADVVVDVEQLERAFP